jgi:hypothetical protein
MLETLLGDRETAAFPVLAAEDAVDAVADAGRGTGRVGDFGGGLTNPDGDAAAIFFVEETEGVAVLVLGANGVVVDLLVIGTADDVGAGFAFVSPVAFACDASDTRLVFFTGIFAGSKPASFFGTTCFGVAGFGGRVCELGVIGGLGA